MLRLEIKADLRTSTNKYWALDAAVPNSQIHNRVCAGFTHPLLLTLSCQSLRGDRLDIFVVSKKKKRGNRNRKACHVFPVWREAQFLE